MLRTKMVRVGIAIAVLPIAYFGWQLTARAAYESAEYTVIRTDASFEIREYPELMLVSTPAGFDSHGNDGSFMRLFRYISGGNVGDLKVAMTTPVFMERREDGKQGRMGFVMPQDVAEQGAPEPNDSAVELRRRASGRFAVIRFAGQLDSETIARKERELRAWMDENGLAGADDVETAGYDPPLTPGILRRNELLIRLK